MKIIYKKIETRPIVLNEEEFPIIKELYLGNPDYKFYKAPSFWNEFSFFMILYSALILFFIIPLERIPISSDIMDLLMIVRMILLIISMMSLFAFIPSIFYCIHAYLDCRKLDKILKYNVLNSRTYEEYLNKPRY